MTCAMLVLSEVAKHKQAGADYSSGVGNILPGDVRGGAVNRLEDCAMITYVCAGNEP